MEAIEYLKVIKCADQMPDDHYTGIGFVPLLGFTSVLYANERWRSTILNKEVDVESWLQPITLYAELADKCELKDMEVPANHWTDINGNVYMLTKFGFKRKEG